jgi:hypothetical protein
VIDFDSKRTWKRLYKTIELQVSQWDKLSTVNIHERHSTVNNYSGSRHEGPIFGHFCGESDAYLGFPTRFNTCQLWFGQMSSREHRREKVKTSLWGGFTCTQGRNHLTPVSYQRYGPSQPGKRCYLDALPKSLPGSVFNPCCTRQSHHNLTEALQFSDLNIIVCTLDWAELFNWRI